MSYSWQDASEQVAGLILQGRQKIELFDPAHFMYPYNELVERLREGADKDLLLTKFGPSVIQTAIEAARSLNGLGSKSDWNKILKDTYLKHNIGARLEKAVKKLNRGDDIDAAALIEQLNLLAEGKGEVESLAEITPQEVPFLKTGYEPIDKYVGGIPEVGLITLAGDAGVGKTSLLCKLANCYVRTHEKNVLIFTLEMIRSEFARRALEISQNGDALTPEQKKRILVCDEVLDINDLCAIAAATPDVGMIGIDFIDQLIPGEVDEPKTTLVYKTLVAFAKRLKVPIYLLVPFSYSYTGGVPRPNHMRYTKMASHYSWMILMLYAPTRDCYAEETDPKKKKKEQNPLRPVPGKGYILCWKVRGGFRKKMYQGPLAVQVCWNGETGWGHKKHAYFTLQKGNQYEEEEDE